MHGVLLRALPYRNANELAMVLERVDDNNQRLPPYLAFRTFRRRPPSPRMVPCEVWHFFAAMEPCYARTLVWSVQLAGGPLPLFTLMGSPALRGRVFHADEETASANRVASSRTGSGATLRERLHGDWPSGEPGLGACYHHRGEPREFEYPGICDFGCPLLTIEAPTSRCSNVACTWQLAQFFALTVPPTPQSRGRTRCLAPAWPQVTTKTPHTINTFR